jgi:uncharacterized membrane protein
VKPSNRAGYRKGVLWGLILASFAGVVVSLYLTFIHYQGAVPRCYLVQGCSTVQTSQYSVILGIPLSLLGTVYFAVMFYLGIGLTATRERRLLLAYKVLAYLGALAAIPLFLLQAVVLKAFCTFCLVTEVLLVVTWIGSFYMQPARPAAPVAADGTGRPNGTKIRPAAARGGDKRKEYDSRRKLVP